MTNGEGSGGSTSDRPAFDAGAQHHRTPKLRPVRAFGAQADGGQQLLGLADARQITERVVFTAPAVQVLLPVMDGTRDIDQIVTEIGRGLTRPMLEQLVAQLDDAGLLEGPRFDAMLAQLRKAFDAQAVLPPGSTEAFSDALIAEALGVREISDELRAEHAAPKLKAALDRWIDQSLREASSPSFDSLPAAIVVPHIDYPRGWMNYAHAWGRMRVVDRPDRVLILGTNHFGFGTGATACDKGYETALGVAPLDRAMLDALRTNLDRARAGLGDALLADRFDHEREHSIELQIPWIQHCLAPSAGGTHLPVLGVLVHDPTVNAGDSYDGSGVGMDAFVDAAKAAIAQLPGRTLVVSSADLSHVGPAFGDSVALAGEDPQATDFRRKVVEGDRELVELYRTGSVDEFVSMLSWRRNQTRWCSIGNMAAAKRLVEPSRVDILNYAAAMDQQGSAMVSHAAIAMFGAT